MSAIFHEMVLSSNQAAEDDQGKPEQSISETLPEWRHVRLAAADLGMGHTQT